MTPERRWRSGERWRGGLRALGLRAGAGVSAVVVLAGLVGACASGPPAPTAASAAPHRAAPPSFHEFRPSRDGFAFVNRFEGSSLPVSLGAAAERGLGLPERYGLCGGMCLAAADYFLARRAIPAGRRPPARGTALYTYLYTRQAASVGPAGLAGLKFLDWMRAADDGPDGTRARTRGELPAIRAALGRGEPVVLGLVLTTTTEHRVPWNHNHQVLAYAEGGTEGQAEGPAAVQAGGAGSPDLRIYDPNFPGRDDAIIRITTEDGLPRLARLVPGRPSLIVRGMFVMPYAPAVPRE